MLCYIDRRVSFVWSNHALCKRSHVTKGACAIIAITNASMNLRGLRDILKYFPHVDFGFAYGSGVVKQEGRPLVSFIDT